MLWFPITIGLTADTTIGEPPDRVHPVARFGQLMTWVERVTYAPTRRSGALHVSIGVAIAVGTGVLLERTVGRRSACAIAVTTAAARRMLEVEVETVADRLVAGDLDAARLRLGRLVGRSTDRLDHAGVARGAIESLAENTVDAVTATVFWAAVGGAPAALAHRAVNTLDAMVGHHTPRYERFGWTAARLDDLLNLAPARLTATAVAMARPRRAPEVLATVRRDAARHPSPNGGVVEAAFAAALGVSLGGVNRYGDRVEDRGVLGRGRTPAAADVASAIRLARHTVLVTTLTTMVLVGLASRAAPCAYSRLRARRTSQRHH
jgi:adenosylcobinamide-phosphate synthase